MLSRFLSERKHTMGTRGPQKGQGGRRPKPIASHLAEGTYDPSTHDDRQDVIGEGQAEDLLGLDKFGPYGANLFDQLAEPLGKYGYASSLDSTNLSALCYWWNEFATLANSDRPTGYQAERAWQISKRDAFTQFSRIAAQFGLSPTARAGMYNTTVTEDHNPFEEYIKRSRALM